MCEVAGHGPVVVTTRTLPCHDACRLDEPGCADRGIAPRVPGIVCLELWLLGLGDTRNICKSAGNPGYLGRRRDLPVEPDPLPDVTQVG